MGTCTATVERAVPQKLNTDLPRDPAIPLLCVQPREWKRGIQTKPYAKNVHSSIVHISQKVRATQMPVS